MGASQTYSILPVSCKKNSLTYVLLSQGLSIYMRLTLNSLYAGCFKLSILLPLFQRAGITCMSHHTWSTVEHFLLQPFLPRGVGQEGINLMDGVYGKGTRKAQHF